MMARCVSLALLAAASAGCSGPGATPCRPIAAALQSGNPADRAGGAIRASQTNEQSAVPLLVELLEDPAADVRLFAIQALKRLTGQTLGYHYYDPPSRRRQAADRWRQWLQARAAGLRGG